ncbi:MAG: MlaD family protein [Thermoleophilaceae bacterium]
METRAPTFRRLLPVATVGFVFLLLTLIGWRAFGGPLPLAPHGYRIEVPLPDASHLSPGADVLISGVHVGDVVEVKAVDNEPRVTIELEERYAPLRAGATAIPRTKSLLGEGYIEIAPGPRGAEVIPEGGEFPRAQVRRAQALDEVLETFSPDARRNLRRLFAGLSAAFSGRAEALNNSLGNFAPVTDNLEDVVRTLDRQSADLKRLVASSGEVFSALGEREGALQAAIVAGDRVLSATARRNRDLAAAIHALPPFLEDLKSASRTLEAASGDLDGAVSALLRVAPSLLPALREIDAAAPHFRSLFRELPAVIAAGNRGLPAVTKITRAAGSSFEQVYPPLRELIPWMELLGELPAEAVGAFANVGQLNNGTVIGSGGKPLHAVGGVPTIWNESIVGWTKRLPSHRSNPYPKPRSSLNIARGGLRAYDCRHLGNRQYLPPTGSGAPPCLLQGPWTYRGKTRYYPHLTLAPP